MALTWRSPGLHGKRLCIRCIVSTRRFPGGMRRPHILRSVEELRVICRVFRAGGGASVCVGMRRYGSPVRCGFWHGMSRYGTPEVVRYVSLCFAMFRSLLRLGPPALSRRRRSSRLRDVALCRALSRAGDLRRSRPPLQWNGCRVCCVGFALFRIGRDFFQGTGPPSGCRCPNTRRHGHRHGSGCPVSGRAEPRRCPVRPDRCLSRTVYTIPSCRPAIAAW